MQYQRNVGIILLNKDGYIFLGHRARGGYSFPQGNLELNEDAEEGARRELYEETGLRNISDLRILDPVFTYMIPNNIGKMQKWIACKWNGGERVRLNLSSYPEFHSYEWCSISKALKNCIWFKKEIYEKLYEEVQNLYQLPII